MKLKKMFLMVGSFCLLLMLFQASGAFAESKVIKLKFANYYPPFAAQSKICEEFIAEFEKRTNGRVEVKYFPGGSLLKAPAMIKGIENGIVDIGLSHVVYTPGRFPVMEACELPIGYPTGWVANMIMGDFYNEFKPKEWDSTMPLWLCANNPALLPSKKPIRTLEDFKGQVIRAPGRSGEVIAALGGVPAPTKITETYDALAKGVVEGSFTAGETVKTFRLGEVVKYVTQCWNIGTSYPFYVAMNKRSYDRLPADIQAILIELSGEFRMKYALMSNSEDFLGESFGKSHGVEYIELTKEESDKWTQAVQPVIENYVKDMVAKGFAESEVRGWIKYLKERSSYLLDKQIKYNIKSVTGPPEVR